MGILTVSPEMYKIWSWTLRRLLATKSGSDFLSTTTTMSAVRSSPLRWKHKSGTGLKNSSTDSANPSGLLMTEKEAIDLITQWSNSGKPFFTKEALRDLGEQVGTKRTKGDKIAVRSLTGVILEGTVSLGHRFRAKIQDPKRESSYI